MRRRVSYIIDDYLSSKNIVLKDNTIIVQPDIIGLKFIYIADEWAWWLDSMESKSRSNRGKEVICTWAIRVKVCCKVVPQEVCYLPFDRSVGLGGVNWWKGIPEINNPVKIKVHGWWRLCLSFLELEALVHEEMKDREYVKIVRGYLIHLIRNIKFWISSQ